MDQYVGWGNDTMNQPASLQGQEVQSHDDSHLQNWKADRRRVKYKGKEEVRGKREAEVQIWTAGGQKKEPAVSVPGGGTLGMAGGTGRIRSRKLFSCIRVHLFLKSELGV